MIQSVHNYIDFNDNIMRKGAISAHKGEYVIIPMNMSDGSIIGIGKGNKDYNFSAPHGAGRVYGRGDIKRRFKSGEFTMQQFEDSMEGIYSSNDKREIVDESKFAYKPIEKVMEHLVETVDVIHRLKPVYNLKA